MPFDRAAHCRAIAHLGGQATFHKYGKKHMRKIGKDGATATWSKYDLIAVGTHSYAMVDRQTGKIKAILYDNRFYIE